MDVVVFAGLWLVLGLLALLATAGVVRGGHREDVLLGYEEMAPGARRRDASMTS